MEQKIPEKLGKYVISRILGKGAMGVVYEGKDLDIGRHVAIKTIHRAMLEGDDGAELRARFKREAQAAGRLMHQNIVAIYEYGEEDGMPFIAMEFVKGKELKEFINKHARFEIPKIVDIMSQALSALGYVHKTGVVHRDLKPANIILLDNGQIKVADFGIARVENSSMTQLGSVMGTPSYMSPEQFMGQQTDKRADIFSLGVILYNLLTGEKPFPGAGFATIMQRVLNQPVEPPTTNNVNVPKAFNAVIEKALAKRPGDRFQCAEDFLEAIKLAAIDKHADTLPQPEFYKDDIDETVVLGDDRQTQDGDAPAKQSHAQAKTFFIAMLETAYEFAPNGVLSAAARTRIMAKSKEMGLDQEEADALDKEVASRFAPSDGESEKSISFTRRGTLLKRETGMLVITSDPEQVTILIDGKEQGQTPLTTPPLRVGNRKLLARKPGYYPTSRLEQVVAGTDKKVHVILEHQTGVIRAVPSTFSNNYPANFYLDDTMIGRAPLRLEDVTVGTHTFRFEAQGHQVLSGEVEVELNEEVRLEKTLQPDPGLITIQSEPAGARVWVDDQMTDHKTNIEIPTDPGKRQLKLTLKGYLDVEKSIQVLPGGKSAERFTLAKNRGRLHLVSIPKEANIWINGRATKYKTDIILKIRVGKYQITLQKEGYQNVSKTVYVESDGYTNEIIRLTKGEAQAVPKPPATQPKIKQGPAAKPPKARRSEARQSEARQSETGQPEAKQPKAKQPKAKTSNIPEKDCPVTKKKKAPSGPGQWLVDNEDGTITDTRHGLVALKDLEYYDEQTWQEAMESVAELEDGSCELSDQSKPGEWRLPTKEELPILIDWKKSGKFIGVQITYDTRKETITHKQTGKFSFFKSSKPKTSTFTYMREPNYWSSTNSESSVWNISMFNGKVSLHSKTKVLNVWPVRRVFDTGDES